MGFPCICDFDRDYELIIWALNRHVCGCLAEVSLRCPVCIILVYTSANVAVMLRVVLCSADIHRCSSLTWTRSARDLSVVRAHALVDQFCDS